METSINLNQIKILGGVGSILSLLGAVPYVGFLLAFVGFILVLIAIFNLEKATKERGIFSKFLIGSLVSGVGVFVIFVSFLAFVFLSLVAAIALEKVKIFLPFIIFCWVLVILGSYLIKKSYEKIAKITKEEKFAQAGFFNFIGAITLIVLVGSVLYLVSEIFAILAFFSLPDELKTEIQEKKVS